MNQDIQSGIIKLPSNFQSTIINKVKKIINEIINESLDIALFFDDSSSNDIIEIHKENLNKKEISSLYWQEKDINAIKEDEKESEINLLNLDNNSNDNNNVNTFLNECFNKHNKKIQLNLLEKKKIIDLYRLDKIKFSIHKLSEKIGVSRSMISDWNKNYEKIIAQIDLNKKNIKGQGKKSIFIEKENELIIYIEELRKAKIAVNTDIIIAKMISLEPLLKEKSRWALFKMCYRILKKYGLSIRKATHLGQTLPKNSIAYFYDFFYTVIKKRKECNILDNINDYNRLINVDETPIFLEMYSNKTIDVKGAKNVIVNTYGNEKKHVTCILAIAGGGKKLIPTLIFKGEPDKNIEQRYQQLDVVKNKKIKIYCQANAWCNDYIFHKWLKDVFYHYEEYIIKQKCILIMDKAPSHIKSNIIDELTEKQKNFIFVPAGLTRFLQPLDVGINKPFKDHLKSEYIADLARDLFKNEDDTKLLPYFPT